VDFTPICRYKRFMPRRKVKAERKEAVVRLRVTEEQRRMLFAAAQHAGLELSAWLRSLGLREARRIESSA